MPDTKTHDTQERSTKGQTKQSPKTAAGEAQSSGTMRHRAARRPGPRDAAGTSVSHHTDQRPEAAGRGAAVEMPAEDTQPGTALAMGVFREVEWPEHNFNGYDAHGVDLCAARLTGICALGANFADALFEEATLQNAALCGATLARANLRHADLRNANLSWSDLRGASLFAADLRGANLAWADLRNVDLREANLAGAYYNRQTKWPADFALQDAKLFRLAESR